MQSEAQPVVLTEKAAEKVREYLGRQGYGNPYLRLFLTQTCGCGNLSQGLAVEDQPGEDDIIFESSGVKMLVEKSLLDSVEGSRIDYVESLQHSGFSINNPHIKKGSGCGCGGH